MGVVCPTFHQMVSLLQLLGRRVDNTVAGQEHIHHSPMGRAHRPSGGPAVLGGVVCHSEGGQQRVWSAAECHKELRPE